jgi:hypothetical protein
VAQQHRLAGTPILMNPFSVLPALTAGKKSKIVYDISYFVFHPGSPAYRQSGIGIGFRI